MQPLTLSVPEQHDYTDPTVEQDARRLHAWLTNLPIMDVVETVRLVSNALEALNEQKLEARLRLQLLGVFRSTVQRLFVTVDPLHLRQLALSRAQRDQAANGVERLLLGMAGGYKIIIKACHDSGSAQVSGRLFGLAINHALEQLGYVLLDSYRFYRSVQEPVFGELHQLYRLARYHGLLDMLADEEGEYEQPLSISAAYHAALMLSLTDPFRLAEGEAGLLYDVIRRHAGRCRVIPGNQWSGDPAGLFLVDLKGEAPPQFCQRLESPATAREPYLLDARAALAAIREQLVQTPVKVRQQSPEAMVLRRLLPGTTDPRNTREPRHPDTRRVGLLLGLEHVHAFQMRVSRSAQADSARRESGGGGEPSSCRVIDSSENGMCLAWDDGGACDARVGELLGVVGDDKRLRLAIIRSVRVRREGGVEIGIQLITGTCAPVYCRALEDGEDRALCALFLPACEDEDVSATLVVTKGLYKKDQRLLIDVAGKVVRACAGRSIFDGPVFDRFEFAADTE